MDTNNWRPPQVGEAPMDAGDWRSQLQPDSRQRIVNKIMDTLKRHLPFSGHEGLQELKKIAVRFEEKIYTAATSQSDYLRKISLKMLTMETKSQNTMANSLQSNSAGNSNRPPDPGSFGMQPQVPNQGQSLSMPLPANQSQARQQLLSQNIQNNIPAAGVQSSAGLSSALPPSSGLTQTSIPSIVGQNQNMQNMGQGVPSNMFATSQRQLPGRQQVVPQQQQQQQSQNSQQYMYQQLQHPQSNMTSLQQSSMSALSGVSTAQQNMMNSLPPSSSMDSGQGNALNSLQQVPVGSNQQTPVSAPQQANMNALSSQSGVNMLQANMNSIQSNSGMLQHQHLKQQQEHQMFQNQLKQQFQHRQMQQQLMQKQQLLQHQQQQQQQLQLQAKQQLPAQLQAHQQQMPQLHQMNDVNDLKMRQGMGVKPGVFQQHLSVDGWFVMQTGFLFVCLLLWCYTFFG